MSWLDQGRQEHGWFGNGTAAPKLGDDPDERSGLDAASSADAAAVRAYLWAKAYGPALFGLPRSGAMLDAFAEAVTRIERGKPGTLARALDSSAAEGSKFGERAKAMRDGMRTLVGDGVYHRSPGGSSPVQLIAGGVPGGGQPDKAWADAIAQNPRSLVGKSAQEIADEFTDHGYPATVRQSGQGSQRALIVDIARPSPVGQVRVHPGEGRHGGAYTQFSTDHGRLKYVDPTTYERTGLERGATKFFDARTGAPIEQNSLRIGRSGGAPPGGAGRPLGSRNVPLEGEPPGTIRPPLGGGGGGGLLHIPGTTRRPTEEE